MMPLHPVEKDVAQCYDEDLELLVRSDELGLDEAWIGEHFTTLWENIPLPDLLIAKALALTRQMKFGTGVVCLPQHHPAMVATRIACLDHLARGRFYFGIGAGGVPTDMELFGIDYKSGVQRHMTREAIEIVLRLWTEEGPFEHRGQYWTVKMPAPYPDFGLGQMIRPFQKPYPPIAVAGSSRESGTLRFAGEQGWIPMSINHLPGNALAGHWQAYAEGARSAGRTVDRKTWRVAREIFVGETNAEARRFALEGSMSRAFTQYMRRLLSLTNRLAVWKRDLNMPDDAITPEYLVDDIWIVGDPATCVKKLRALYDEVGGFGTLLMICHDWDDKSRWLRSLELLAKEVVPALADA
jgi:alkanesulfonate monooxygenase SsuD/methylene tetrahydromethanopterin reductase-like flavin-dependent oxidoreductase (luciferase family)